MAFQMPQDGDPGPSSRSERRPSTHSVLSPSEQAQMDSSLSARRRRHSVRDFLTGSQSRRKAALQEEVERRGSTTKNPTGDPDGDTDQVSDEEQDRLDGEVWTPPKPREAIQLKKGNEPIELEDEEEEEEEGVSEEKQEYVWDGASFTERLVPRLTCLSYV